MYAGLIHVFLELTKAKRKFTLLSVLILRRRPSDRVAYFNTSLWYRLYHVVAASKGPEKLPMHEAKNLSSTTDAGG